MVYLAGMLAEVEDAVVREELVERLDIVQHKIKFMDLVPVAGLYADNSPNIEFTDALGAAGGIMQLDVQEAVYLLYFEAGTGLNDLMSKVPASLAMELNAVKNNRVILLDRDAYNLDDAESCIGLVEDLAEMTHPGAFIFGNEGSKWIRFSL